jgi:hypothetical protein
VREKSYGESDMHETSAKQSQLRRSLKCETKPIWPVGPDLGGRNVRNKPNFREPAGAGVGCTNPDAQRRCGQSQFPPRQLGRSVAGRAGGGPPRGTIVRQRLVARCRSGNKPNLPQTGREDHRQGQRPWRCHPAEGNCVKTRGTRQAGFRAQGLAHFPGIW